MELRSRGEGFNDIAAVEGSPKAAVGRALCGHERMFADLVSDLDG
jgi:hypothetical protein